MNVFLIDKLGQGAVEINHAFLVALFDDIKQFALASLKNIFLHDRGVEKNLQPRNPGDVLMKRGQEFLVDDRLKVVGEQLADLAPFVFLEKVIDPAEGLPG